MRILFLLFLAIPLIEIYFLVQVGDVVGAGMTVFLVIFTATLGFFLVRQQGLTTLMKIQQMARSGENPAVEIIEGIALFIAGGLLLTPGFMTDALGFILLVPLFRRYVIYRFIARRQGSFGQPRGHNQQRPSHSDQRGHRVIEGEFRDSD